MSQVVGESKEGVFEVRDGKVGICRRDVRIPSCVGVGKHRVGGTTDVLKTAVGPGGRMHRKNGRVARRVSRVPDTGGG